MKIHKSSIIKLSTIIICTILFFSIHTKVNATISQTDGSFYGSTTWVNGYLQTLGGISGSEIQTIQVKIHSTAVSTTNTTEIRVLECSLPSCINSSIEKSYEGYTSSSRTYKNLSFTSGYFDGYLTFNFQYSKELISNTNITNIPINVNKYYAIWAWSNDSNNTRYYGSISDSAYLNGSCYSAAAHYTSVASPSANSPCLSVAGLGIADLYFVINGVDSINADLSTRIISFSPANGTTTGTNVTFNFQSYIAENDISFWQGYRMNFYAQKQPVGIPITILDNISATTTGNFNYSKTINLSTGNYILNACLQKYYLGNIIGGFDLFGSSCQYHQFIVGTSTFLGNLFQSGITTVENQVGNLTPTSSIAILSNNCNPFSGFDIIQCFYALLIPTSSQLQDTMNTFYSDFLTRVPWGYGSVVVADLLGYGNTASTSLSASNLTIVLPNTGIFATATSTAVFKGKSMTFIDWNQMASSTVKNYWAPALTPLNNFLNIMMGAGFIFWLYHFFKKMRP